MERFHIGYARILTATASIRPAFIVGFRLQRDAKPLDAGGIAGFIEFHSRNADARVVSLRDEPRKEVQAPSGPRAAAGFRTPSTSLGFLAPAPSAFPGVAT